ncbi:MAG: hypothetical protein ACRENI_08315 [Gemmatimonadaceae bacterium]
MFPQRSIVSRKTPKDGKLEITGAAADALRALGSRLEVVLGGVRKPALVASLRCGCRGEDDRHTHHFLQSELLKTLPVGEAVEVDLRSDEAAVVVTAP